LDTPDPSRFTATSMSVSLVLRLMDAVRMESASLVLPLGGFWIGSAENAALLTGRWCLRYCGMTPK
jgi:hypothetical protein